MVTFSAERPGTHADAWPSHPALRGPASAAARPGRGRPRGRPRRTPGRRDARGRGLLALAAPPGSACRPGGYQRRGQPSGITDPHGRQLAACAATSCSPPSSCWHPAPGSRCSAIPTVAGPRTRRSSSSRWSSASATAGVPCWSRPWRHDGHPDHEAAGRAAATTRPHRRPAGGVPIWLWHWAEPEHAPWDGSGPSTSTTPTSAKTKARGGPSQPGRAVVRPARRRGPAGRGPPAALRRSATRDLRGRAAVRPWHSTTCTPPTTPIRGAPPHGGTSAGSGRCCGRTCHGRLPPGLEVGGSSGALAAGLATRCGDLPVADSSAHAVAAAQADGWVPWPRSASSNAAAPQRLARASAGWVRPDRRSPRSATSSAPRTSMR